MSQVEIEAEWDQLGPGDVRDLASKSWLSLWRRNESKRRQRVRRDDPRLLSCWTRSSRKAMRLEARDFQGKAVRARLKDWTTG